MKTCVSTNKAVHVTKQKSYIIGFYLKSTPSVTTRDSNSLSSDDGKPVLISTGTIDDVLPNLPVIRLVHFTTD